MSEPEYRDEGCPDGFLPSCLSCPLPKCRYDVGETPRKAASEISARYVRITELAGQGLTANQIAERERVSRRTVFRALEHGGRKR